MDLVKSGDRSPFSSASGETGTLISANKRQSQKLGDDWITNPDSRLIEVCKLAKRSYPLHHCGGGAEKVGSRILAGLKVSFHQLEA